MFEQFFDRPSRILSLRDGPGSPLLEGYAKELCQAGYAEITARRHIRAAEHLLYWTEREGIPIPSLTEKFLERFDIHLDQCQCPRFGHSNRSRLLKGVRLFLKNLRGVGVITAPVIESTIQDPALLAEFCQWMHQQRGSTKLTLYSYSFSIRDLLKRFGEDPIKFDAQGLRHFVLEKSQQSGWAATKQCATALRMFLRFLIAEGKCHLETLMGLCQPRPYGSASIIGERWVHLLWFGNRSHRAFCNLLKSFKITKFPRTP